MKPMNNIFTALIQMLSTISVRGEADTKMMAQVFDILHRMERAANEPEKPEEDGDGNG